jgi:hypothetical protein
LSNSESILDLSHTRHTQDTRKAHSRDVSISGSILNLSHHPLPKHAAAERERESESESIRNASSSTCEAVASAVRVEGGRGDFEIQTLQLLHIA